MYNDVKSKHVNTNISNTINGIRLTVNQGTNIGEIYDAAERALSNPNIANTHTPEEINTIKEYIASNDEKIENFVISVNNKTNTEKSILINNINDNAA